VTGAVGHLVSSEPPASLLSWREKGTIVTKSMGQHWMGTTEAARYLGVTHRTLHRLIEDGELRTHKLGRITRLRGEDLDAYLAPIRSGRRVEASPAGPGRMAGG